MAPETPVSLRRYTVSIGDQSFTIDIVETAADRFEVSVEGRVFEATRVGESEVPGGAVSPGVSPAVGVAAVRPAVGEPVPPPSLHGGAAPASLETPPAEVGSAGQPPSAAGRAAPTRPAGVLTAPMPGVVLEVFVEPGSSVRRGDPMLVLEAMKMRNTIRSPQDGVVSEVVATAGAPVSPGDPLVRLGAPPG